MNPNMVTTATAVINTVIIIVIKAIFIVLLILFVIIQVGLKTIIIDFQLDLDFIKI